MKKFISTVIPSFNEEKTIAKCIESALEALEGIQNYEIILVDSYSNDKTIEIAKKYPISIFRLKKAWPKSPAAGRYIGTIKSKSKYIFFVDADMEVDKQWITKALNILEKNSLTASNRNGHFLSKKGKFIVKKINNNVNIKKVTLNNIFPNKTLRGIETS